MHDRKSEDRSSYERFAIPYSFKPSMSVKEASIWSVAAFLKIFLGSLWFALWGTFTLLELRRIGNWVWRVAAIGLSLAVFTVSLSLLMLAISGVTKRVTRRLGFNK
jgi:hypothetical protein